MSFHHSAADAGTDHTLRSSHCPAETIPDSSSLQPGVKSVMLRLSGRHESQGRDGGHWCYQGEARGGRVWDLVLGGVQGATKSRSITPQWQSACCLSSPGLQDDADFARTLSTHTASLIAQRTSTEGAWVAMKKADLQELPILDMRELPIVQLRNMSALFDEVADMEFERLPSMAHCPVQRKLDDGISDILSLPDLSKLRDLLSSEPFVSNLRL